MSHEVYNTKKLTFEVETVEGINDRGEDFRHVSFEAYLDGICLCSCSRFEDLIEQIDLELGGNR